PTPVRMPTPKAKKAVVVDEGIIKLYQVETDTISELATGQGVRDLRWLDANTISLVQDGTSTAVVKAIDIASRSLSEIDRVDGNLLAYDIHPDRSVMAALVARSAGQPALELRYLVGERPVQRLSLIPHEGRGVGWDDQIWIRFSPSGDLFAMVDTAASVSEDPQRSPLQVRRLDGSLIFEVGAGRGPTMAAWAPDGSLIFRSDDGVRRWRSGNSSSSRAAAISNFYDPWVAPNSRFAAYDTGARSTRVQVRRVEIRSGKVSDIGPPGRMNPVYARVDTLWMQIAQRCEPECLQPVVGGPQVFAINPNDGKERLIKLPTLEGVALWYE
ncbi:MAG: hypothetical protein ACLGH3_08710, partial [Actinomycetota bacterium]